MTTPKYKSQEGPYVAYQSLVDSNCWIVRFGTLGPVYDYPTPVMAANACDALNAAYTKGYAAARAAGMADCIDQPTEPPVCHDPIPPTKP